MGPVSLGGSEERRGIYIRGRGLTGGAQVGQKESLILCGREHGNPRVAAGQRELQIGC